jgi:hypothetical protein
MDDRERDPIIGKPAQARNPFALVLTIVGALGMVIATFLPFNEPVASHQLEHNALIQNGLGWLLAILALVIAASGYSVGRGQSDKWLGAAIPCVLAALLVLWLAMDKELHTLYPVGPNGRPDKSQPGIVTTLGIAVYVAGAGVAAAFVGALMLRKTAGLSTSEK